MQALVELLGWEQRVHVCGGRQAQEYATLRERREANLATSFVEAERQQETHEGTAQYIGLLGVTLTLSRDKDSLAYSLQERLRRPVQRWSWLTDLNARQRGRWHHLIRLHDTGAAMAVLMDDLVSDWKHAVQNGAPLYDVLRQSLDGALGTADVDVDSLLRAYGYRGVLEDVMRMPPYMRFNRSPVHSGEAPPTAMPTTSRTLGFFYTSRGLTCVAADKRERHHYEMLASSARLASASRLAAEDACS